MVENLPAVQETWVQSLSQKHPLEKEVATHSSILVWRIPWTEELGQLQSMGSEESDTTEMTQYRQQHASLLCPLSPRVCSNLCPLDHYAIDLKLTQYHNYVHECVLRHVLFCYNPMDWSSPGSSVHGIFQARILEWVAIFFSKGSSQPRDRTHISCLSCTGRQFLASWATREAQINYTSIKKKKKTES